MPDWKRVVSEHIESCGSLPPATREEVVSELAAHLEETYEAALGQGLSEDAAIVLALQEVNDWHALAARIHRARSEENPMNNRTRSLWLPAMVNLIAAPGLLMIFQKLAIQPRVLWIGDMAMVLYLPWLIALPIFGAFGAFLAKRASASSVNRLIVGLSPALAVLGAFALVLPVSLITDRHLLSNFPFAYFVLTICNWVVLPASALLLGILPFLYPSQTPATDRSTT
ncbi:MAG: hypothetical protein WA741_15430 [Candidatus Sulfotelmatobacter sp.]